MRKDKILVTGACGQIGTVLTENLRAFYGHNRVIATDIHRHGNASGPFIMLDILNAQRLDEVVKDFGITQIYHLAAILSASGEWNPHKTWNVNFNGWFSMLEMARNNDIKKLFFPSTIAVFGASSSKINTPQHSPMEPSTIYGISKVSGELLSNYYFHKYGLDIRSLRYPGIIGHESVPSGGTTDYAVEIFYTAIKSETYTCFLKEDTDLPMIYMPDAIRATIELMESPAEKIKIRTSYNLSGMNFAPKDIFKAIQKYYPDFQIRYQPDFRQKIAESWTHSIDDKKAREDWNWKEAYDLAAMTNDMIKNLKK